MFCFIKMEARKGIEEAVLQILKILTGEDIKSIKFIKEREAIAVIAVEVIVQERKSPASITPVIDVKSGRESTDKATLRTLEDDGSGINLKLV